MNDYTFDLPSVERPDPVEYPKTVLFDFEKGDFVLNGKGDLKLTDTSEACKAWCSKALNIERYSKRAYSKNLGIEFEMLKLYPARAAKESCIKRTVTETLLADPKGRVLAVDNFTFDYPEPDVVIADFVITLKNGVSFDLEKEFVNG